MKKIKHIVKWEELPANLNPNYLMKNALFLDIETTGFSASQNQCYLIGTAYQAENSLIVEQFFAETIAEEPLILNELSERLQLFHTLIFFNGKTFDLPFIKKRMKLLKQPFVDDNLDYVDLFSIASSFRAILQLENYKQKTIEHAFGINREDACTGKDLIQFYLDYTKNPTEEILQVLLKHNYDDVLGMISLLNLFSYSALIDGKFDLKTCTLQQYQTYTKEQRMEFFIETTLYDPIPKSFSCNNELVYCTAQGSKMTFRIPIEQGELKYFYPDYKNYYYLPKEDQAIHKSVAAYVEKAHRIKATKQTCYGKKAGLFLPQLTEFQKPAFYKQYKDPISYFEFTENFQTLKPYCVYLLNTLIIL